MRNSRDSCYTGRKFQGERGMDKNTDNTKNIEEIEDTKNTETIVVTENGYVEILEKKEWTYDDEKVDEILLELAETGDYRNIEIRHGLSATFLVEAKDYMDSILRISFRFGNGGGPTLKIPKVDIEDNLEEILTKKLKSCARDFEEKEIRLIAKVGQSALKNSVVYNTEDEMNLNKILSEMYHMAYYESRKPLNDVMLEYEKYIPEENSSLATITLINDPRYGECICINDKRNVFGEVLEFIGCNWSVLQVKKELRDCGYLVTDYGNPYSCLIQTKKAKELGVRKIVKIPVKRIEAIVKPIKKEIEAERLKKANHEKRIREIEKIQAEKEAAEKRNLRQTKGSKEE